MENKHITVNFFFGANSEKGFVSHFEELQNLDKKLFTYLIKGTPGSGKSTLMRAIAKEFSNKEGFTELIHCSSDPDSLDGVILHDCGTAIVDATAPHSLELKYPLASDCIINLFDCLRDDVNIWSISQSDLREKIVNQTDVVGRYHKRFCDILSSVNSLLDNNRSIIMPFVDFDKLSKAVKRLAHKEFSHRYLSTDIFPLESGENKRMLTAPTPKGLVSYDETIAKLCSRIYFIHDEHRAYSPAMLSMLRSELLSRDINFYSCYSVFKPQSELDAIIVPEYSVAFATVNKFTPMMKIEATKSINAARFIDTEIFRQKKAQLAFYRKTAHELLNDGISLLASAKLEHDKLETLYTPIMDFQKVTAKMQIIC